MSIFINYKRSSSNFNINSFVTNLTIFIYNARNYCPVCFIYFNKEIYVFQFLYKTFSFYSTKGQRFSILKD